MLTNDRPKLIEAINSLHDLYGKPKLTTGAAQIWWDTVKEFDNNDIFTIFGYWAQRHGKHPMPADVWRDANEMRTNRIEEKAAFERSSNRGMVAHDFRPNEVGRRALKACIAMLKDKPKPEGRHGWARKIVAMHARGENVPYLTLQIARQRLDEIDPNWIDL
jgi:hypothetical protein